MRHYVINNNKIACYKYCFNSDELSVVFYTLFDSPQSQIILEKMIIYSLLCVFICLALIDSAKLSIVKKRDWR